MKYAKSTEYIQVHRLFQQKSDLVHIIISKSLVWCITFSRFRTFLQLCSNMKVFASGVVGAFTVILVMLPFIRRIPTEDLVTKNNLEKLLGPILRCLIFFRNFHIPEATKSQNP